MHGLHVQEYILHMAAWCGLVAVTITTARATCTGIYSSYEDRLLLYNDKIYCEISNWFAN